MNAVKNNQVIVTGDGNQFEKISISEKNDGSQIKKQNKQKVLDIIIHCKLIL